MSSPDLNTIMQQFLASQQGAAPAVAPEPKSEPAPEPVTEPETVTEPEPELQPTAELKAEEATFQNVDVPALLAALAQGGLNLGQAAAPAPEPQAAPTERKWQTRDIQLSNGEPLQLRVSPKGYGCVGFETRKDFACFFGYLERHEALADLLGDGYRNEILKPLKEMACGTRTDRHAVRAA